MSVVVLTPNNRRQIVKVTPHTTIFHILEEVCKKYQLNTDDYDLVFHKSVLDVSSIIKFAGIPNNAVLEMIPITRRRFQQPVNVGVQLENGERVTGDFQPNQSVWDVIQKLCPDQSNIESNPVIIYLLKEIYGLNALEQTTLLSLGLTGGRAMFRLVHKNPEMAGIQANVSKPLPSKPVIEQPYKRKMVPIDENDQECKTLKEKDIDNENQMDTGNEFEKETVFENMNVDDTDTTVLENEPSLEDSNLEENNFIYVDDQDTIIFSLDSIKCNRVELSDNFFDVTVEDVRKLFIDLQKKREDLENSPLMTNDYKEILKSNQILHNLNAYKKTLIRIQFPDRIIIQAIFRPVDTVNDVKMFLRKFLVDETLPFYLFTIPPKKVLNDSLTLVEANCVPNVVLYFGSDTDLKCLKPEFYGKLSTFSSMKCFFDKIRNDNANDHSMPSTSKQ